MLYICKRLRPETNTDKIDAILTDAIINQTH